MKKVALWLQQELLDAAPERLQLNVTIELSLMRYCEHETGKPMIMLTLTWRNLMFDVMCRSRLYIDESCTLHPNKDSWVLPALCPNVTGNLTYVATSIVSQLDLLQAEYLFPE